ncbi:MAG: Single-stranded DNA-binding protein [Bacteroidetes bacterium ADurb.Bin408]|nr:MAG: Single-stranded DNA-binding protein [Bacteroidetes bacterium ADurb.Bin408]
MKTNINKVELSGYAGMDIRVREFKNGSKMACFSLSTHESYKNKEGAGVSTTTWHHIVLWNEQAERAEKAVRKGLPVVITGKLRYRCYQTQAGEKKCVAEIVADKLDLAA